MKVLTILGSPRKNAASTAIARHFNDTAEALGAEVTTYELNTMDYKACQGCFACKAGLETCALDDDLTDILAQLHEADAVVLTSPIYFGDLTAQLKGFFDRLYSTVDYDPNTEAFSSRLPEGKRSLFIFTQGAAPTEHKEIPERYDRYLATSGFEDRRTIRDCSRTDIQNTTPAQASLDLAEKAARDFMAV